MKRRITDAELQHIIDLPNGQFRFGDKDGNMCALGKGLLITGLAQGPFCSLSSISLTTCGLIVDKPHDKYGQLGVPFSVESEVFKINDDLFSTDDAQKLGHVRAIKVLCDALVKADKLEIIPSDPAYRLPTSYKEFINV